MKNLIQKARNAWGKAKDKAQYAVLAPAAYVAADPALAGPLETAVNQAKTDIGAAQSDLLIVVGAMIGLAVVIFVGMKIVGIFRKG